MVSQQLARWARKNTWWIAVGGIIFLLDVLLLYQYFGSSSNEIDEEPLPENDFSRLLGSVNPTSARPRFRALRESHCSCDPLDQPSHLVRCYIDENGQRQTRIKGNPNLRGRKRVVSFQCATLEGTRRCQCCDCSHEVSNLMFDAAAIKDKGTCQGCAVPTLIGPNNQKSAYYGPGPKNQMLFSLPLNLQFDYSTFALEIIVSGNFSLSRDNDPIVGIADGLGTVLAAQRGDNGIWFTAGRHIMHALDSPITPRGKTTAAEDEKVFDVKLEERYDSHFLISRNKAGSRAGVFGLRYHVFNDDGTDDPDHGNSL
jgi:hypothetical protein